MRASELLFEATLFSSQISYRLRFQPSYFTLNLPPIIDKFYRSAKSPTLKALLATGDVSKLEARFELELNTALDNWVHSNMRKRGLMTIPDENVFPENYYSLEVRRALQDINYNIGVAQLQHGLVDYDDLVFLDTYFRSFDAYKDHKVRGELNKLSTESQVTELANIIWRDCRKFIEESNGRVLYRGSRHANGILRRLHIRKNRNSLGSDVFFNKVDSYMAERYVAHRSNSILCTGDAHEASNYGRLGAVFMIGNFDFSWHPKIRDYAFSLEDLALAYERRHEHEGIEPSLTDAKINFVFDHFRDKFLDDYSTQNLQTAISSMNEIMLTNDDGFYLVDAHYGDKIIPLLSKMMS